MQNEERINGLETQVRTLKRIVCLVCCLMVAGIVVSATSVQTVPDVIQAKRFEVVNDAEKVVAELAFDEDGGGEMHIRSNDEEERIVLTGDQGGGGVLLFNSREKMIAGIGCLFGDGLMFINDSREQGRVAITTREEGGRIALFNGSIEIFDEDEKKEIYIGVDEDGNGVIQTQNDKDFP